MTQRSIRKKVLATLLSLSFVTTSFSSALCTSALAAEAVVETPADTQEKKSSSKEKGLWLGLAAVGLAVVLTNHGDSDKNSNSRTTSNLNSGKTSSAGTSAEKSEALTLLNQDRAAKGLSALKHNSKLTSLADNYATDMIKRGYFSHYDPEGKSPFDRMKKAGIRYKSAGENLAINSSVAGAQRAFMNSSGHRANILNSNFTEIGIGVMHSSDGSVYVVQEFIGN